MMVRGHLAVLLLAAAAAGTVGGSGPALASERVRAGALEILGPWARASIGAARPAAAFFTVVNAGAKADRLLGVSSPVAGSAMVHRTRVEGGVARMMPAGPVAIPAGARLVLKPGGLHVMLMKLKRPLARGSTFPMMLRFERAGTVRVTVKILSPGAMGPE